MPLPEVRRHPDFWWSSPDLNLSLNSKIQSTSVFFKRLDGTTFCLPFAFAGCLFLARSKDAETKPDDPTISHERETGYTLLLGEKVAQPDEGKGGSRQTKRPGICESLGLLGRSPHLIFSEI
jgi:hypothetical protein